VVKNPRSKVILAHCPQCSALVVRSGAKGTVVARGVDDPDALGAAGALSGARHALFLDFEIEGSALVLRARITSLQPALPIVHAKTLTTSTASPALLRTDEPLKSAEEARKDYLDALQGRSTYLIPLKISVRSYASPPEGSSAVLVPPFIWLEGGMELALTQARAWTASFSLGATWLPDLHKGWKAQGRISRLLTGTVSSLTLPDVYGFLGASIISIYGNSALAFSENTPTIDNILATQVLLSEPQAIFPTVQLGVEMRVKNRIGVGVMLESLPTMNNVPSIGKYIDVLGFLKFHSLGAEVSFCF
jgi:hypothetical protein